MKVNPTKESEQTRHPEICPGEGPAEEDAACGERPGHHHREALLDDDQARREGQVLPAGRGRDTGMKVKKVDQRLRDSEILDLSNYSRNLVGSVYLTISVQALKRKMVLTEDELERSETKGTAVTADLNEASERDQASVQKIQF